MSENDDDGGLRKLGRDVALRAVFGDDSTGVYVGPVKPKAEIRPLFQAPQDHWTGDSGKSAKIMNAIITSPDLVRPTHDLLCNIYFHTHPPTSEYDVLDAWKAAANQAEVCYICGDIKDVKISTSIGNNMRRDDGSIALHVRAKVRDEDGAFYSYSREFYPSDVSLYVEPVPGTEHLFG